MLSRVQCQSGMDATAALDALNRLIFAKTGKQLNTLQSAVFCGTWLGQKYQDIAASCHCSDAHIKTVGAELWELLSQLLGEPVSKKNLRSALERWDAASFLPDADPASVTCDWEFPEGQVRVGSRFYIQRPPIEDRCYQTLLQPGALLRIKAPRQMGKTSLLARMLHHAQQQGMRTIMLDLQFVDSKIFQDLDRFLQWFCARVTRGLELPLQLADYWHDIFGSKTSCKDYFEGYLLPQLEQPLVLALDEVDEVFQYPEIADNFFALLRGWHEDAKNNELWQKLRLVLAHSTEGYIPLNINQSPFNVGLPIELPEFNAAQISTLAHCYGLAWQTAQVEQLMNLVGGHPYLTHIALYHMASEQLPLEAFLRLALTEAGLYSNHLRRHLLVLQQQPQLASVVGQLARQSATETPPNLTAVEIFQLHRMGLIQLQGSQVRLRCELYRQYFSDRL
ncbi:AAA-like domain-containing protein [Leptolyngbya sp. NK1-12]|nr:AAA-like domain-containing protein [Leptolyngbya sp. NK1-12]